MKKILVSLAAGILLASALNASAEMKMGAGVKGGLAFSNFSGDSAKLLGDLIDKTGLQWNASFPMGFNVSAFFCLDFNTWLGLQLEAGYSKEGGDYTGSIANGSITCESKVSLNYLEIPLLVKVTAPIEFPVKPFVSVGPSMGILLSAKDAFNESMAGGMTLKDTTYDLKNQLKSIDFGLTLGAGASIDAGPGAITIEGRYALGVTQMPKESSIKIKNNFFGVLAGYNFKF
jgi:hypothetical protein